jgi:hypothetical protein
VLPQQIQKVVMFRRFARVIAASILATLVVVPVAVRAQQRVRYHDLGHHDPIPTRLRLSWNSWTPTLKVKAAPQDTAQRVFPLPAPTAFSVFLHQPAAARVDDERVPLPRLDRTPLPFRGPPAPSLS